MSLRTRTRTRINIPGFDFKYRHEDTRLLNAKLRHRTGACIPLRPWCIPLCFRFSPYFRQIFFTFCKISKSLPFPEKISHFHPPKFLTTFFFSHRPQILDFPPIFPVLVHSPSDSRKFIISPLLFKIPPCFPKIQQLFTYFTCIPPYFDHDAFMHHPMHILDAPDAEDRLKLKCMLPW